MDGTLSTSPVPATASSAASDSLDPSTWITVFEFAAQSAQRLLQEAAERGAVPALQAVVVSGLPARDPSMLLTVIDGALGSPQARKVPAWLDACCADWEAALTPDLRGHLLEAYLERATLCDADDAPYINGRLQCLVEQGVRLPLRRESTAIVLRMAEAPGRDRSRWWPTLARLVDNDNGPAIVRDALLNFRGFAADALISLLFERVATQPALYVDTVQTCLAVSDHQGAHENLRGALHMICFGVPVDDRTRELLTRPRELNGERYSLAGLLASTFALMGRDSGRSVEVLQHLRALGIPLDAPDSLDGWTPLLLAVTGNGNGVTNFTMTEALLACGADPTKRGPESNPLTPLEVMQVRAANPKSPRSPEDRANARVLPKVRAAAARCAARVALEEAGVRAATAAPTP